jgi:hypothetical protein
LKPTSLEISFEAFRNSGAPLFAFSISRGVHLGGAHYSWQSERERQKDAYARNKIKKTLAWFGARRELNKKEEEEVTAA